MRYVFLFLFLFSTSSLFGQNDSTKQIIFGSDYDYPPYEFINKKGEYDGFHIDLMRAIGKEMGYKVEINLGNWTYIREELEQPQGRINVADMFYSEKRVEKLDFLPHHDVVSYVIVRNKKSPPIKSISQLKNEPIVVTANAIAEEYIKKEDSPIKMIQSVTDLHALKIIASKRCNYALINQYTAHKFIEEHNFDNLAVSEEFVFSKNLSFVVKKGDTKLAKDIEEGMNRIKENGIYSELYVKWFDNEKEAYTLLLNRLKWASIILLSIIFVVGSWIFTLRKQVQRKTRNLLEEAKERHKMQKLLFQKNEELEKRNYELDKFVYSVSHNVRSPIASALGLVSVIQLEFEDNVNLSFYVSNIGKSLHKLDYYVNKILAYVANKNFKIKKERIHFDGLVAQLIEEAKFLVEKFRCPAADLSKIEEVKNFDIIINATSVGMSPQENQSLLRKELISSSQIVFDVVYVPYETKFLKEAREKGAKIIHGLDMFLYQGVAQFELFTGHKAPEEVMKKVLYEHFKIPSA